MLFIIVGDDPKLFMSERSFRALAAHCKLLTTLQISCRLSPKAREWNVQPGDNFPSLISLIVQHMQVRVRDDIPHIATSLGKLCPRVSQVTLWQLHVKREVIDHWPFMEKFHEARRIARA